MFTAALAVTLVVIVGEDGVKKLGGTTALLLLCVFTGVNIACLALRREKVEHTLGVGMAPWEVYRRWIDHREVNAKAIEKS